MFKRVLVYSIIAVLGLTLVGGTIAILARPNDVEAYSNRGPFNQNDQEELGSSEGDQAQGSGGGRGRSQVEVTQEPQTQDTEIIRGQGQSQGTNGGNQDLGNAGNANDTRGQGNDSYSTSIDWETITGVVLISDSELTVDTGSGELLVGLGQSWYREEQGFKVDVGDEVSVEGYEEEGEFKAAVVENLTLGTSIVLRDPSGRPMWSGQNTLNSSGAGQAEDSEIGSGYDGSRRRGQGQGSRVAEGIVTIPELTDTTALACPICATSENYDGPLTEDEVNALYLSLNDEYHAWAVYEQVIGDFGSVRPFTSIQNAEANHIAALLRLFDAYGLVAPDNTWIGQLEGFENLGAACTAGVQAEIANGGLYDTLLTSTERNDILDVYSALQRASLEQHLPAFMRCAD